MLAVGHDAHIVPLGDGTAGVKSVAAGRVRGVSALVGAWAEGVTFRHDVGIVPYGARGRHDVGIVPYGAWDVLRILRFISSFRPDTYLP